MMIFCFGRAEVESAGGVDDVLRVPLTGVLHVVILNQLYESVNTISYIVTSCLKVS